MPSSIAATCDQDSPLQTSYVLIDLENVQPGNLDLLSPSKNTEAAARLAQPVMRGPGEKLWAAFKLL